MRTKTMYDVIYSFKKAENLQQRMIFIPDKNLKFQPNLNPIALSMLL